MSELIRAARSFRFDRGWGASLALSARLSSNGSYKADEVIQSSRYSSLLDYFPTRYGAIKAYAAMVKDCRKAFSQEVEDEGVPRLLDDLSPAEVGRQRYAHSFKPRGIWANLGPRWGRGLGLYTSLLPSPISRWLTRLLQDVGVFQCKSSSGLAKGLKCISDVMKKQGSLLSPYWRYAVNLETLGGYRSALPIDRFIPELINWATGDVEHKLPDGDRMSEDLFLHQFRLGIRSFFDQAPSVSEANKFSLSLDAFVRDPSSWGVDGSTQVRRAITVFADGKLRKLERSKRTTGLLLSPYDIKRMILAPRHIQVLKPIEKLESGKVRSVVNADDTVYLKMAFVSNWVERALRGHPHTTLFMTPRQRADMWQRLGLATRNDSTKIPLDQSHFDWQPNKRMIAVCIDEIRSFIERNCTVDRTTMLHVCDSIMYTLVDAVGYIHVKTDAGEKLIPVEKGVMSGWRWTALIDTLCNVGELHAAEYLCSQWGFDASVTSYVAQGDDDQVQCPSFSHATALAAAYSVMNFEINPGKFFIDTRRDEFLRLVPLPDGVVGYPSRAINNILWRNPINPDPLPGELSIKAQLAQWILLINRGCDQQKCLAHMLDDMCGRNKGLTRQEIVNFLVTPAPYGGCGLIGTTLQATEFLAVTQSRLDVPFQLVSQLPGLAEVRADAKALGVPEKVVANAVNAVLPLGTLRAKVTPFEKKKVSVSHAAAIPASDNNIPIAYRMSEVVPLFIQSAYTTYLVRNNKWDVLYDLADEGVKEYFVVFRRHMTLSAFKDWVLGKLDVNGPVVLGYSPEQTSVIWKRIVSGILFVATLGTRITRNYFRAAATASTRTLIRELQKQLPVSG